MILKHLFYARLGGGAILGVAKTIERGSISIEGISWSIYILARKILPISPSAINHLFILLLPRYRQFTDPFDLLGT